MENLGHFHSDHSLVFVRCGGVPLVQGETPFCFQGAWIIHPEFDQVVQRTWNKSCLDITFRLAPVRTDAKIFNHEVFENIFGRKIAWKPVLEESTGLWKLLFLYIFLCLNESFRQN